MSSETKRNAGNKVPVALPRSEPDTSSSLISRDAVYKAAIGARIRLTTTAPNSSTYEGTLFVADPISNFLVICSSPTSPIISKTPSTPNFQPGSYHVLQISTIQAFQLLDLPQAAPDTASLHLDASSLPLKSLQQRLTSTISKLTAAQSRLGPPGTDPHAQDLFNALSRLYPMRWHSSNNGSMIFSDEYVIERPYNKENCGLLSEKGGSVQGLERLRKVLVMEEAKLKLKMSAKEFDRNMTGKEAKAVGLGMVGGSPRKGG